MRNTFWIAANIIFDLKNGDSRQVLMLVNTVEAASIFTTQREALTALSFVQARATNIQWFLDARAHHYLDLNSGSTVVCSPVI